MSAGLSRDEVLFKQRLWRQAGLYIGKLDGVYGAKSAAASEEWDRLYRACRDRYGELDGRSEGNIRSILPVAQEKCRELLALFKANALRVKVLSGVRTYAEQTAIYAQGRSKPGKIVTRAKAGQSNHHWGLAWDIGLFSQEGAYLGERKDEPLYKFAADTSRVMGGLERGADWPNPDLPHYQIPSGLSQRELRRRFEAGERILSLPAQP